MGWEFRGVVATSALDVRYADNIAYVKTGYGGTISLYLINVLGQKLWSFSDIYPESETRTIPLPIVPSGIYILRVNNSVWYKDIMIVR
jgi:hypothetical protein